MELGPLSFEPGLAVWVILPGDRLALGGRGSYGFDGLWLGAQAAARIALSSTFFIEGAVGQTTDAWRAGGAIGVRPKHLYNVDYAVVGGLDWFGLDDGSGGGTIVTGSVTIGFGGD
jgi:hypothetical protein